MSQNCTRRVLSLASLVLMATATVSGAPIFIKFDGVEGEVARGKDKWIEVQGWDWEADREGKRSCASQRGSFTVAADSTAVPALTKAARKGKTFREVTVDADGELHTLQAVRVKKIDAFTVKAKVVDLSYGRCLTHAPPSRKK